MMGEDWLTVGQFIERAYARSGKRLARVTVQNMCRTGVLRAWSARRLCGKPARWRWLIDPASLRHVDLAPPPNRRFVHAQKFPSDAETRRRLAEQRGGTLSSVMPRINQLAEERFQIYLRAGRGTSSPAGFLSMTRMADEDRARLLTIEWELAGLWRQRRVELAGS